MYNVTNTQIIYHNYNKYTGNISCIKYTGNVSCIKYTGNAS